MFQPLSYKIVCNHVVYLYIVIATTTTIFDKHPYAKHFLKYIFKNIVLWIFVQFLKNIWFHTLGLN